MPFFTISYPNKFKLIHTFQLFGDIIKKRGIFLMDDPCAGNDPEFWGSYGNLFYRPGYFYGNPVIDIYGFDPQLLVGHPFGWRAAYYFTAKSVSYFFK